MYSQFFTFLFAALLLAKNGHAQIRLPRLISDGMVIQRDQPVKLWGRASAGEKVQVTLGKKNFITTTDNGGNWSIELPVQPAGCGVELIFKGNNTLKIKDICFGDVWICAGQSNMVLPMERVKERYPDEIKQAAYPEIRQFTVPSIPDLTGPKNDLNNGAWKAANQQNILTFSATAYFFAKAIYEKYQVPIGLINSSYGGTPIEAWISEQGLSEFPNLLEQAEKNKDTARVNAFNRAAEPPPFVFDDAGLLANPQWSEAGFVPHNWRNINVPGYWEDQGVKSLDGVVWYRKEFDLPSWKAGLPAKLYLGRIVDADFAWVNGTPVGNITYQYPPRRYNVPEGVLKPGKNTIVVRVLNYGDKGGFVPDKPCFLQVSDQNFDLSGQWQYKVGAVFGPRLPDNRIVLHHQPSALFNAMVAPLTPFTAKGFLWYQGETNVDRPENYHRLLPALIADWRKQWNNPDLPFFFVQLANFKEVDYTPAESNLALLREAQRMSLAVPKTAMAVTIDAGEWNDIHPLDKKTVGTRLSLCARALAYGENNLEYSGPVLEKAIPLADGLQLTFGHTGEGLVSNDGESLRCFAVAGADKKFYWADAEIENDKTLILRCQKVAYPVWVRFAWADNPDRPNLYNREGLPASPFQFEIKN